MACAGQSIAANSAIIGCFIAGPAKTGKSYDDIPGADPVIGDEFVLGPARSHRSIHGDGPDYVPYIRCLSAKVLDPPPTGLQLVKEILRAIDNDGKHLSGDISFVPVYRR